MANEFQYVKAPNKLGLVPRPWIFLAGSIEMGKAQNWQQETAEVLLPYMSVLNPRREDWDSSWVQDYDNSQFRKQVEWELAGIEKADAILFHFEADTQSPITLLELGLVVGKNKENVYVSCPQKYWRRGNVETTMRFFKTGFLSRHLDIVVNEIIKDSLTGKFRTEV